MKLFALRRGLDKATQVSFASSVAAGDTVDIPSAPLAYEPLSLADMERRHIHATLNSTSWNKSRAASILGIERSTLDRKIRRYELGPDVPG